MPAPAKSATLLSLVICFWFALSLSVPVCAQQVLGSIVARVRVQRGDVPPQRILVALEYLGAPRDSAYTDGQGMVGFHSLSPGSYRLSVSDEQYEPVLQPAELPATSLGPTTYVDITLIPRARASAESMSPAKPVGSNPNIIDMREYSALFPKKAVKEFEKGVSSDADGKREDAIRHYQKAVEIAPDFYLAHNNLGSDYQGKSDFPNARKEFERVVQLNQSDAAAYFNLSNICMLTSQLPEAQQYLDEGLRRQPDSGLGQFLLGSLDLRTKKFPQAELALLRAIQLSPTMPQPRLQLVNLLLQQGRKDAAASQLHDFIEKLPDSPFSVQAKQVLQRLETSSKTTAPASN